MVIYMNEQLSKREKYNIMFTKEERQIILDKAIKYGYGNKISEYIRDACIYEKVYVENIDGKKEIFLYIDKYLKEVRTYIYKLDEIMKKKILADNDIAILKNLTDKVDKSTQKLIQAVTDILSTHSISNFQKKLRFIEKNKVTDKFIDSVIRKEFVVIQPSNLQTKRIKGLSLLLNHDSLISINISPIKYNEIIVAIDEQRELALQNNYYLLFNIKEETLEIRLVRCYKNHGEALKQYSNMKDQKELEIIDIPKKEG